MRDSDFEIVERKHMKSVADDGEGVWHLACDIDVDAVRLKGDLRIPPNAAGLVLFAHGSGSSRASPRNRQVAEVLHAHGLATLLFEYALH